MDTHLSILEIRNKLESERDSKGIPFSSTWYRRIGIALDYLDYARSEGGPLKDRVLNAYQVLYSLSMMLYKSTAKRQVSELDKLENNAFQEFIKHLEKRRDIQACLNTVPKTLIDAVLKAEKTLLVNETTGSWRESRQNLISWQTQFIKTSPDKVLSHILRLGKDLRNAFSHPGFSPEKQDVKQALELLQPFYMDLAEHTLLSIIQSPLPGTTGRTEIAGFFLDPFVRNSDGFFSDYYLEKLFKEDFPEQPGTFQVFKQFRQDIMANLQSLNDSDMDRSLELFWVQTLFPLLNWQIHENVTLITESAVFKPTFVLSAQASRKEYHGSEAGKELQALVWIRPWRVPLDRVLSTGSEDDSLMGMHEHLQSALAATGVDWGILSNGNQFRLFHRSTAHKPRSFLEVDLHATVQQLQDPQARQAFHLFTSLFSQSAFQLELGDEQTRLSKVLDKSERYGREIGDELKKNVYKALEWIGDGFLHSLRSEPDLLEKWQTKSKVSGEPETLLHSDELMKEIYQSALIVMFRLLFVFYAESRDLLPMDLEAYRDSLSLESLRNEIRDTKENPSATEYFSAGVSDLWARLSQLFGLVNLGLDGVIPAYNGGLFDPEKHIWLESWTVPDRYLAEAIDLLSRAKDPGKGKGFRKVAYRDLDVRHIGTIYEGLLEYSARLAEEELVLIDRGKKQEEFVPLTQLNDKEKTQLQTWQKAWEENPRDPIFPKSNKILGVRQPGSFLLVHGGKDSKRKSSGSYYTPDYIVQYIVENTLGSLVRGEGRKKPTSKKTDFDGPLPLNSDEILELKVLDPAMGSGHFLVAATEYLAKAYGQALIREGKDADGIMDEQEFIRYKRMVAERCIYGVDLNPMAVELAKLSIWLFTMDLGRPLSFLNHHLKCGNSLLGAWVDDLAEEPLVNAKGKVKKAAVSNQANIFEARFLSTVPIMIGQAFAMAHTETNTPGDIAFKKNIDKMVEDLKQPFRNLANAWTAVFFGESLPADYLSALMNVKEADHFSSLEANRLHFFHWELEFPEVFFNEKAQRKKDSGFDAVIGNPPYVRQELLTPLKTLFEAQYEVYHGVNDLYVYFFELGIKLLSPQGVFSVISASKWMRANYGKPLRVWLKKQKIQNIFDFGDLPVFDNATTYPCIVNISKGKPQPFFAASLNTLDFPNLESHIKQNCFLVNLNGLTDSGWALIDENSQQLLEKLGKLGTPLKEFVQDKIYYGIKTGLNDAFVVTADIRDKLIAEDTNNAELLKPFLAGRDIKRYQSISTDNYLIFTKRGVEIQKYPSILNYLEKYKESLTPKPKGWKGINWPGRKAGNYKWYEIQDTVDYWLEFESIKIIWPGLSQEITAFTLDTNGFYGNDNNQIIVFSDINEARYVLGLLNSKVAKFFLKNTCDAVRGGYYRLKISYVSLFPIVNCINRHEIIHIVSEIESIIHKNTIKGEEPLNSAEFRQLDHKLNQLIYDAYKLDKNEINFIENCFK